MNPLFVKYFNVSYERNEYEYIVKKDENRVYLCSKLTFNYAKKINKENELWKVSTRSLPKDWCHYTITKEGEVFDNFVPSVITNNESIFMDLISRNFLYISRICDFFSEFSDYSCNRNFERCCIKALSISEKYLPENLLSNVFHVVFDNYMDIVKKNRLKLIMDDRIGKYMETYQFV